MITGFSEVGAEEGGMAKMSFIVLAAFVACVGCTTCSLERHTLNQIRTSGDYRSQEVLNCLATVAANPDALPSFALLSEGVTRIQDTETLTSLLTLTRAAGGFATESLATTLKRSPEGQWTLGPAVEYERLAALRCACRWVLFGAEQACSDCPGLLADPQPDFPPGPHFGVANRLAQLPAGWLQVGRWKDVPKDACYKGHCCDTWVWVTPERMQGLADFTLVLHDIATLDTASVYPTPILVTLTRYKYTTIEDPMGSASDEDKGTDGKKPEEDGKRKDNSSVLVYQETRVIKPEFKALIEQQIQAAKASGKDEKPGKVALSYDDWINYTIPYRGTRLNVSPQGGKAPKPPISTPANLLPTGPSPKNPPLIRAMGVKVNPSAIEITQGGQSGKVMVTLENVEPTADFEVDFPDLPAGVNRVGDRKIRKGNLSAEFTFKAAPTAPPTPRPRLVTVVVYTLEKKKGALDTVLKITVKKK
jgi:hypothetical protein